MSAVSLDAAREALGAGEPERLVGLAECSWLDVKNGVYDLGSAHGAEELLKDVAAFANARDGGLVLVGFSTTLAHDQEVIDEVRPVPRNRVSLDRHRKLLDRLVPVPLHVSVSWLDCGDEKGILVIDVPAQPPACLPVLVPGSARTGSGGNQGGAVPVRDGDRTRWLTVADMQRLLAAGWSQNGGHGEEVMSDLVSQAVAAARVTGRAEIQPGEGDPSWERRFREVADAVRGQIGLGTPAGRAYREGPGTAQHFNGHPGESWVLCALPGRKPVMVAELLWERAREAGAGAPGADAFAALGFPVLPGDMPPAGRLIAADAPRVEFAEGAWGPGFLVSGLPGGGHRWDPAPRFTFNAMQEADSWPGPVPPQLRIRATASFPGAGRIITPSQAERLSAAARRSEFAESFRHLAGLYEKPLAVRWGPGRTGRGTDRWSEACTVTAPDGTPALAAEAIVWAPGPSLAVIVEVRVEDFATWQAALRAVGVDTEQASMRLDISLVQSILTDAWEAVALSLPAALDPDPALGPYSAPPVVEFRLSAGQPPGTTAQPDLDSLIDFCVFGSTDRHPLPLMTLTVHGPIPPDDMDRFDRTGEALSFMAQGFGFPGWPWAHVPIST